MLERNRLKVTGTTVLKHLSSRRATRRPASHLLSTFGILIILVKINCASSAYTHMCLEEIEEEVRVLTLHTLS